METTEIVLFNSDKSAKLQTGITGWVSRHGRFFGSDERAARYDGCTHRACEDCGSPVERGRLVCETCSALRDVARYNTMPKGTWDGKGMVYSVTHDRYFSSWDEVEQFCEDEEIPTKALHLVICEPQHLHLLDPLDYGVDEMAEDGELPDKVITAIEAFNDVIKETPPVSWTPGKFAVILD
jgi:hypothetical protein